MIRVNRIEDAQNKYGSYSIKKYLTYGLFTMLIGTMSGCSMKAVYEPTSEVIVSLDEQKIEKKENIVDRFGSEVRRPLNNKIKKDDKWAFVKLYKRDVRYYNDGSIGYSDWNCLGEYLVLNLLYLDSKLEYKYELIDFVNVHDFIENRFSVEVSELSYFDDSLISLDSARLYDYSTRDYINGEYTEWNSDSIYYISDKEYNSSDVIKFKDVSSNLISKSLVIKIDK